MNLAKIIATITTKPASRTAAELRAALAEIDQPALERKVDDLEARRRKLLLAGTDDQLEAIGRDITGANLACERAAAAADELKALIERAEARENAQQLEAQAAAAQQASAKLDELYGEIDRVAHRAHQLLAEAAPLAAVVARWNGRAEKLGRDRLAFAEPTSVKQRLIGAFR